MHAGLFIYYLGRKEGQMYVIIIILMSDIYGKL